MLMRTNPGFTIAPASVGEAQDIARLALLASDGLTALTWRDLCMGDETVLEVGARRAARTTGGFSYRNAEVAFQHRRVVAAIVSFPIPDGMTAPRIENVPSIFAPLVRLEARAAGTWNVNILATYPEARNQGVATALIAEVEQRAVSEGYQTISMICRDSNPALRLYRNAGFEEVARAPMVTAGTELVGRDWILLFKSLPRADNSKPDTDKGAA